MHSIHRTAESDLSRTKIEKQQVLAELEHCKETCKTLRKDYNTCKIEKDQLETKFKFTEEKLEGVAKENEFLVDCLKEHENKLTWKELQQRALVEIDSKTGKRISVEQAIAELHSLARIGEDPQYNSMNVINYDKYLPIEQVEIYEKRYNDLNVKYMQVLEEMHAFKLERIGEEVLIQERDERISKLNEELDILKGKY